MIQSVAWFCEDHCGSIAPDGCKVQEDRPAMEEVVARIGRPIKYYSRMTAEARSSLCAASLAMRATNWREMEIGLLSAHEAAWRTANEEYFRDYLANGRSLGRGNLFIYTLPTSALGEVAIALKLTGPTLHIGEDKQPIAGLIHHAQQMADDGEAAGMLALWSDNRAAVCLAIGGHEDAQGQRGWPALPECSPMELANHLRSRC